MQIGKNLIGWDSVLHLCNYFYENKDFYRKAMKVERLGYKVFCYISWADGKKIRVKDMEKENRIQVEDPLIFEHDKCKDLPFVLNEKFLFYNSKKLNIVGYFHRINSKDKEVFTANLVEIDLREEALLRDLK